jgi:hypothetical protein
MKNAGMAVGGATLPVEGVTIDVATHLTETCQARTET